MPKFKVDFNVTAKFELTMPVSEIEIEAESEEQAWKLADDWAGELEGSSGTTAMQYTELYGILVEQGVEIDHISEYIDNMESDELLELECSVVDVEGADKV